MDYSKAYEFNNDGEPNEKFKDYQIKILENTVKLLEFMLKNEKLEVIRLRNLLNKN
jgi:hypothetical protein